LENTFNIQIARASKILQSTMPYSFTYTKTVKQKDVGKTLFAFYSEAFPNEKALYWHDKIKKGKILINNKIAKTTDKLQVGWITQHTRDNIVEPQINSAIKLIYENENILVLDKPAPLPVHASGRFIKNTVLAILEQAFPQENYKIVHRLDANTTGLLVLAKNSLTASELIAQFSMQKVQKTYLAWVEGILEKQEFTIEEKIDKNTHKAGSRLLSQQGEQAKTQVKVLKYKKGNTLVLLTPKSGRTNQLRLHLASIGHAIVGDLGYKNISYFEQNPMTYPTDCLMLHAWKLQFKNKGKRYVFEAQIPKKLI
jgi:23S rRNA pseudouridine1911/1915/1917 synthase